MTVKIELKRINGDVIFSHECVDIMEECVTAVSNVVSAKDKYFAVEWNPHEVQSKGDC